MIAAAANFGGNDDEDAVAPVRRRPL